MVPKPARPKAARSGSEDCRRILIPRAALLPPGSQGLEAYKGRGCGDVDQPLQSPRACVRLRMLMGCTLCLVVQ